VRGPSLIGVLVILVAVNAAPVGNTDAECVAHERDRRPQGAILTDRLKCLSVT
jgi:hypothetical protein